MNDEELKYKPFIYSTSQQSYQCFIYQSDFTYKCFTSHFLNVPIIDYEFCVYDYVDSNPPIDNIKCKKKIILSSPNTSRYKEFIKREDSEQFFMPEWSYD